MKFRPGLGLRVALVADLWVYLLGVVLFILLPLFPPLPETTNEITAIEAVLAFLVIVPTYGLAGRLLERPHLPLSQWGYLATAGYGLLTLATFLTFASNQVVVTGPNLVVIIIWFSVGIVGASYSHVFDGSKHPVAPKIDLWVRSKDV